MDVSSNTSSGAGISESATIKAQPRLRNLWTKSEDEILMRGAAMLLDQTGVTNAWSQIAAILPRRTNKDCRKRWIKIRNKVNKGTWTRGEDARLVKAVQQHGQCWTQVAQDVQSRHADQCAKRWQQCLDPNIVSATWRPQDVETLLAAVKVHGHKWKTIADEYLPSRSTTDIKNRYLSVTKERTNPIRKSNTSMSDDFLRESSHELDLESSDSLSGLEDFGTADVADIADTDSMPDADTCLQMVDPPPFTPAAIDLDTSLYPSDFNCRLMDHDANFPLTLTYPMDLDGHAADGLQWDAATSNPFDGNAGHLDLLPSLLDPKLGLDGKMNATEPSAPITMICRSHSSKTTLVLEDVEPATLCKVITILAEAKTKVSMQLGENYTPKELQDLSFC